MGQGGDGHTHVDWRRADVTIVDGAGKRDPRLRRTWNHDVLSPGDWP